jgi:hypothetical protein
MGKELDKEKNFIENVDHLLNGEEIEAVENMGEDYYSAINFAQKLNELRADPSPEFKEQLKQRLLTQLTQQEAEAIREKAARPSLWESLAGLIPQSPVWRTVTATVVVVLATVTVLWRTGVFTPSAIPEAALLEAPAEESLERGITAKSGALEEEVAETEAALTAPAPATRLGIEIPFEPHVRTDKDYYITGEDVVIEVSLRNVNPYQVEIDPFPPTTEIEHRKHSLGDKPVRSFPPGTEIRSLGHGEVATYTLTWDQRDDNGQRVDYGYYTYIIRTGEVEFGFGGVLILPPEGVIEKTIEVNESQTVNGITVTLERVELSFSEAKFYAFTKRSEGFLPSRDNAAAEYRLDNGSLKNAGTAGFDYFEDRFEYTWGQVDPVAKGTRELTFIITRVGEWEGPWEFTIRLQD